MAEKLQKSITVRSNGFASIPGADNKMVLAFQKAEAHVSGKLCKRERTVQRPSAALLEIFRSTAARLAQQWI